MSTTSAVAAYRFEGFILDTMRGALLTSTGEEVTLRRQAFQLLHLLVDNAGRLLDRDRINQAIWPDVTVSDDSITQCVRDIRRALGDDTQRILRTVPRRGYVIAATVTLVRDLPAPAPGAPPGKPSIAVLPFANLSGDPEQEYFADGMAEEIITALSRVQWLFVIARNSSFTYKGRAVDVTQVGRELGVRYVLEGSVRKGGNRLRIAAQLIETEAGAHLWADRFEGSPEDVFDLQDQVAARVAGVIEPAVQVAEARRSAARPTTDLGTYDLYLRALATFFPISKERIAAAVALFEQAIELDPNYAPAHSWAALCHQRLVADGWATDPEQSRLRSVERARRALDVGGNDPAVLVNAASTLAYFNEDIGAMIGLTERALALNANFARGWFISGVLHLWGGDPDTAIQHVETMLRLSPRERPGQPLATIGTAHLFKRAFDTALAKLLLSIQDQPGSPGSYRVLAACYAHLGRREEAAAAIAALSRITSQVMPAHLPWRRAEHRALMLSGLRLAIDEHEALTR
jgi:TolB-like protein